MSTGAEQAKPELVGVAACPACGSGSRTAMFESRDWIYGLPGTFTEMRCSACVAVYPDPRPSADGLAAYYPADRYYAYKELPGYRLFERADPLARAWYATVRGVLAGRYGYHGLGGSRLLGATIGRLPVVRRRASFGLEDLLHPWQEGGMLLDVGCGSGAYLDLMRALGWARTVGVDIDAGAVERVRELGIEAHVGELSDVGFASSTFDAVTVSHTLEHVADPAALLVEVGRVTRPGGRIVLAVPNVRGLASRLLGRYWVGLDCPRHLVNFSPRALGLVLARSGLTVQSMRTSARGAYGSALFSISRARQDPPETYTDELHRFGFERRAQAGALALAERLACAAGRPLGEELLVVARA